MECVDGVRDIIHETIDESARDNRGVIKGLPGEKRKVLEFFASMIPSVLLLDGAAKKKGEGGLGGSLSASVGVPSCRGRSHTYSLVLLGGPVRELAMDGYLDTCFFRGQEAASMAPPRTSSREPPQAMKMAAPNSNLQHTIWYWYIKWYITFFLKVWISSYKFNLSFKVN